MNSVLAAQLEAWKKKQLPYGWQKYIEADHTPGALVAGRFGTVYVYRKQHDETATPAEALPDVKLFGETRKRVPRDTPLAAQKSVMYGYISPSNRHNLAYWFRIRDCWRWLTLGKAQTTPLGGNPDKPASARDPRGNRGMRKAA